MERHSLTIQPCQSLFVAPCSHVWHYKCIRPILNDHKSWPQFLCPNCRAVTDLDAEVDDPLERWDDEEDVADPNMENATQSVEALQITGNTTVPEYGGHQTTGDNSDIISMHNSMLAPDSAHCTPSVTATPDVVNRVLASASLLERRNAASNEQGVRLPSGSYLRPVTPTQSLVEDNNANTDHSRTPSSEMLSNDGPMTPTNNAGPFVFDGSAGRPSSRIATEGLSEDGSVAA